MYQKRKKGFINKKAIVHIRIVAFLFPVNLLFHQYVLTACFNKNYLVNSYKISPLYSNKCFNCGRAPPSELFLKIKKQFGGINMKNYKKSDYAINKYASGIVYRTADQIIEITLSDYLETNPDKTEQDFYELKALSDEIYLEQDRKENVSTRKNVSLENNEQIKDVIASALEENYIEKLDKQNSILALKQLFEKGNLTDTQKRRFKMYLFDNLSLREIAKIENVAHISVYESICTAKEKLKKFFEKF